MFRCCVFGRFVRAVGIEHARKTQRVSRLIAVHARRVNLTARDFVRLHFHHIFRFEPNIRRHVGIHARVSMLQRNRIKFLAVCRPFQFRQTRTHFGDTAKTVILVIIDRAQQRADTEFRALPAPAQITNHHHIHCIAQMPLIRAFKFHPIEIARARLIRRVGTFCHDAFQPRFDFRHEKFVNLFRLAHKNLFNELNAVPFANQRAQTFVTFLVRHACYILTIHPQHIKRKQFQRQSLFHFFDAVFAFALTRFLKRQKVARVGVIRNRFTFDDGLSRVHLCAHRVRHIGIHRGGFFQIARKQTHLVTIFVRLHAETVHLRFERAFAHTRNNFVRAFRAFRELHANRFADSDFQFVDRFDAAFFECRRDQTQIARNVVTAFQIGAQTFVARFAPRQAIQHRHIADAQTQTSHRHAQQITRFARARLFQ